eukprot:gene7191-11507_t
MTTKEVEDFKNSFETLTKEFQQANKNQQDAYEKSISVKKKVTELLKNSNSFKNDVTTERKELQKIKDSILNSGDWVMESFLGSVNSYYLNGSNERRIEFKREYEQFKYGKTIYNIPIVIIVGFILPMFFFRRIYDQAYQLYMAHAYMSLAFRENILKVNGSSIHPWWIKHHYYSILLCLSMLTWPYTETYMRFRPWFYYYALYISIVQLGQYLYQQRKLYTQQTLGKANYLDTANSDSTPTHLSKGSFYILLPLLFIGDIIQLFFMYTLVSVYFLEKVEWQVLSVGILFGIMGFFNFTTTWKVMMKKIKQK